MCQINFLQKTRRNWKRRSVLQQGKQKRMKGGRSSRRQGEGLDGAVGGQGEVAAAARRGHESKATEKSHQLGHKTLPKATPMYVHACAPS